MPLPPGLLAALRQSAARYRAMLRVVADDGRRAELAAAVATAEHAQQLDSGRVRELARWASAPGSARADGVPPTSYPARAEHTYPDFPRTSPTAAAGPAAIQLSAAVQVRRGRRAPTTARDRPEDWINAGQALQRVPLTASTCGIAAALHTQPLELGWLRDFIRQPRSACAYPQMVLRFGAVIQVAASVRWLPKTPCPKVAAKTPMPVLSDRPAPRSASRRPHRGGLEARYPAWLWCAQLSVPMVTSTSAARSPRQTSSTSGSPVSAPESWAWHCCLLIGPSGRPAPPG